MRTLHLRRGRQREEQDTEPEPWEGDPAGPSEPESPKSHKSPKSPKRRHSEGDREFLLNQYQGGMCISGVLKTTERTPQRLISPLSSNWVATGSAVWRYVLFTLALV